MKPRIAFFTKLSLILSLCTVVQAQNSTERYIVRDLGALSGGGFSQPGQVNQAGVVAGFSVASDGLQHPVLWFGDQLINLNNSGDSGLNADGFGINAFARVSIQRETSAFDPNGEDFCAYGTHHVCTAAVWQGGRFQNLPTLGGNNSTVGNVNIFGQIPGVAETAVQDSSCAANNPTQRLRFRAVIWGPDRRARALEPFRNDTVSVALWINDKGQAVGTSGTCDNTMLPPLTLGPHAVLWEKDGTPVNLGNLGSSAVNAALGVNNRGQAVGASSLHDGATPFNGTHGFLWTPQRGMVDLGTLPGDVASVASAINDVSEMVGTSIDPTGNLRAVYWHDDLPVDLNTQVAASSLYLLWASDINDRGEIAGWGVDSSTGEIHTFLAIPNRAGNGAIPAVRADSLPTAPVPLPEAIRQRLQHGFAPRSRH